MEEEIWKPVVGYEGYYEISNKGRVKSIERFVKQGNHTMYVKGCLLKQGINIYGYPYVTLSKEHKGLPANIHRLLAEAYIPNPDNLPEVDHINTDRADYRLENLRWVTHKENLNNEISLMNRRNSTYAPETVSRGMETRKRLKCANGAKTVYQYTKDGVLIKEFYSMEEAKRETGAGHICEVLDDCTRSSGGFLWASSPNNNFKYQVRRGPTAKVVQRYDMSGNLIGEWESISEAARQTGIHVNSICRNIKAEHPTKYRFKYKEET